MDLIFTGQGYPGTAMRAIRDGNSDLDSEDWMRSRASAGYASDSGKWTVWFPIRNLKHSRTKDADTTEKRRVRKGTGYISEMSFSDTIVHFAPPLRPLDIESTKNLRESLSACPDVAFAHLVDVKVEGVGDHPSLSLLVWLVPDALGSLRGSLNLVSEAVAGAIPRDRCVDVVILNSAPDLLEDVERAGCLFVERDSDERRRALDSGCSPPGGETE